MTSEVCASDRSRFPAAGHSVPLVHCEGDRNGMVRSSFRSTNLPASGRPPPPYRFHEVQKKKRGIKLLQITGSWKSTAQTVLTCSSTMSLNTTPLLNSREPGSRIKIACRLCAAMAQNAKTQTASSFSRYGALWVICKLRRKTLNRRKDYHSLKLHERWKTRPKLIIGRYVGFCTDSNSSMPLSL